MKLIKESVAERIPYENYRQYISEALLRGTEIIAMAEWGTGC